MAENELKWYDIFVVLFGTVLSIADPITDILTLVEFYRTDHKTWFGVGLTFIILPSFFFLLINYDINEDSWSDDAECQSKACKLTHILVLGFNPLLPAWLKLRMLYCYLKKLLKLWQGNNIDQTDEDLDDLLGFSKVGVLAEASLESAPQFIIQLNAMAVQQQSVSIIQMVSLPVSFLSIAWASTVADEFIHHDMYKGHLNFSVKDRVLLFVTHLFILSSRLFAVALFTVSYKWWVTSVLILHCTVITICDRVLFHTAQSADDNITRFLSVMYFCLHWLRDDSVQLIGDYAYAGSPLISNALFVIENITMILLFYFSHFPHTWYSLPVTICVCLFAVLGAVMRLTHFYFLYKESDDQVNNTDRVQQQSHSNSVEVAAT
ncbi:unnamed protein product [Porites lobata]|uniref:XK-related protein n=1 Tax=Porites lobata TaxID=104759 RepID=A0ABN8R8I1_9CNID|nr:unnamed protein product [Porites lobata]